MSPKGVSAESSPSAAARVTNRSTWDRHKCTIVALCILAAIGAAYGFTELAKFYHNKGAKKVIQDIYDFFKRNGQLKGGLLGGGTLLFVLAAIGIDAIRRRPLKGKRHSESGDAGDGARTAANEGVHPGAENNSSAASGKGQSQQDPAMRGHQYRDLDEVRKQFRNLIVNTPTVNPAPSKAEKLANGAPCHQILNGLYLGNDEAFAQTTHLPCRFPDSQGRMLPVDTSNEAHKFTTVITCCPLWHMFSDYIDWIGRNAKTFADAFSKNGITWHYVGKMTGDESSFWEALAYDCTECDPSWTKDEVPEQGWPATFEEIRNQKTDSMNHTPVLDWFEPLFKEIDKGVINGEKVLVHCQGGKSRSATILAAYLINRFGVSSAQAINFLKSKRLCVAPEFSVQLDTYAQALQRAREIAEQERGRLSVFTFGPAPASSPYSDDLIEFQILRDAGKGGERWNLSMDQMYDQVARSTAQKRKVRTLLVDMVHDVDQRARVEALMGKHLAKRGATL